MTSPIETNNVVERLREADDSYYDRVAKQHYFSERDVKRETQSLSDRIDVLEGALLARIQSRNDCIDACVASVTDCQCRAELTSLTQGGKTNG